MTEKAVMALRSMLADRGASPRTVENYIGSVKRLDKALGGLLGPPDEVRKRLRGWRMDVQKRVEAHALSPSSVLTDLAALRAFYDAVGNGDNPAREIKGVAAADWLPRPVPAPDVERLLAVVVDPQDRAMIELYLNGLRNVEVCRLDVGSLRYDEEERTLVLRVVGKGGKLGEVVLHPGTSAAVSYHLLRTFGPPEWKDWVVELSEPEGNPAFGLSPAAGRLLGLRTADERIPLFRTAGGTRMTRRESNRRFAAYRNQANLSPKYGPHALRHTCATEMLEHGVDLRVVAEVLRHKSLRMTERYTKVSKGLKAAAMGKLPIPALGEAEWTR